MKRSVIRAVVTMGAKALVLAVVIGVVVGVIGYVNQWDSKISYSNGFFVAGCLMIIAGTSSRYAASQGWSHYQTISGEGFRGMSSSERVAYIIDSSSPVGLVILGVLTGLLLILVSAIIAFVL